MQKTNEQKNDLLLDLNLLRVLDALIKTQSITRSGELLNLSQPAASRQVAKLKKLLSDPLLVRTSKGYVLTQFAESLKGDVASALSASKRVFLNAKFDPVKTTRAFRIAATDYGALTVFTPFISRLRKIAPDSSLKIEPWTDDTLAKLESGELDLALYADEELPPDFHFKKLFEESYSLIARQGHPLFKNKFKTMPEILRALSSENHLQMVFPSGRVFREDNIFERLGGKVLKQSSLAIPYFNTAPLCIADSDLVMIVPSRIANLFLKLVKIDAIKIPSSSENFEYRLVWHERAQKDLGNKWLRNEIGMMTRTTET